MTPSSVETLKSILLRIHDNSAHALNRTAAMQILLRKRPELWQEYQAALDSVDAQAVHQDFGTLLDQMR
jgi:hypothetical protein